MNHKHALHLVVVASVLMVATVVGIGFALNRPHTTLNTVATIQNLPSASPSAPASCSHSAAKNFPA